MLFVWNVLSMQRKKAVVASEVLYGHIGLRNGLHDAITIEMNGTERKTTI